LCCVHYWKRERERERERESNMSLTLSCKLVEVFAMICAVLLQNQVRDSVVKKVKVAHTRLPSVGFRS